MSFAKTEQLLSLATLVSAQDQGVPVERYAVSKRTTQHMLGASPTHFPDTTIKIVEAERKRWSVPSGSLRDLMKLSADELAALDLPIAIFTPSNLTVDAEELTKLRQKIVATAPRTTMARLKRDLDALLEVQGLACRPGPRRKINMDWRR